MIPETPLTVTMPLQLTGATLKHLATEAERQKCDIPTLVSDLLTIQSQMDAEQDRIHALNFSPNGPALSHSQALELNAPAASNGCAPFSASAGVS